MSAGPMQISGLTGWVGWLFIHIAFLTGYRNRLGAILTWWTAFTRDRRRERAFTTSQVGVVADVYAPVVFPPRDPSDPVTARASAAPGEPVTPGPSAQMPRRAQT